MHHVQCREDSSVDGADAALQAAEIAMGMVAVEPGGAAAHEFVHAPRPVGVAQLPGGNGGLHADFRPIWTAVNPHGFGIEQTYKLSISHLVRSQGGHTDNLSGVGSLFAQV